MILAVLQEPAVDAPMTAVDEYMKQLDQARRRARVVVVVSAEGTFCRRLKDNLGLSPDDFDRLAEVIIRTLPLVPAEQGGPDA